MQPLIRNSGNIIALTFELQVIGHTVPKLALSSPTRPTVLHADDVLQLARAGRLVALVFGATRYVAAVGETVEELARLGGRVEHVLRRQAQHFHDLHHLIELKDSVNIDIQIQLSRLQMIIPRWSQRTVALPCASPPRYNPDSTCRWPGRTGDRVALPASDRTDSVCTGKSENEKQRTT